MKQSPTNKPYWLTKRSSQKEWLDLGPAYYHEKEYIECYKILFKINRLLGVFTDTVRLLKRYPHISSVLDVGCGNGLFLLHLSQYFSHMNFAGIDISAEAIALAQQELHRWQKNSPKMQVSFQSHSESLSFPTNSRDAILVTLVCHHLTDEALIDFLQSIFNTARHLVIINDLHRHFLAECFYAFISPLLFRNRIITHDGLISIQRGFVRVEWKRLLHMAGIQHYQIKWRFPFRWQIILWKK